MKIDLNRDFEDAFPSEAYGGFTMKQCMVAVAGFLCALGVALVVWRLTGLGIVECSYIGIPVMIPICAAGFYAYQGQTPVQMASEMWHVRNAGHLIYAAQEMDGREERIFMMHQGTGRKGKKKKRRKREHGSAKRK